MDDEEELDMKRVQLSFMLGGDCDVDGDGDMLEKMHVEELVAS